MYINQVENLFPKEKFEDLLSYVYSYKETDEGYFNKTLFTDFLGLSEEKTYEKAKKSSIDLLNKFWKEIGFYKRKLKIINNHLKNIKISTDEDKFLLYVLRSAINYYNILFDILDIGVRAEINKLFDKIENYKRISFNDYHLKRISELEKKIRGERYIENHKLKEIAGYKLFEWLIKGANSEKYYNLKILEKISKFIGSTSIKKLDELYRYLKIEEEIEIKDNYDIYKKFFKNLSKEEIKQIEDKRLSKKISAEQIKKVFEIVFNIYGIEKQVRVDNTKSNVYDAEDYLYIPNKSLTLSRVLALIAHEIETHYITKINNKSFFGYLKEYGKYLEKEESLAVIMEKVLFNKKPLTSTYGWLYAILEMIDNRNDFIKFLEFYNKYENKNIDIFKRFLRLKRNYPFDKSGIQLKDISYHKGIGNIYEYMNNGGDWKNLFVGKINLSTIINFQDIVSDKIKDKKFLKPLFVAEWLKYLIVTDQLERFIEGKLDNKDIIDFIRYIKYKYGKIGFKISIKEYIDYYFKKLIENRINWILKCHKEEILQILGN